MKKIRYFIDMDGVIADFNGQENAVARFETEKGFFRKLAPISARVQAVQNLIDENADVTILSASPNEQADIDKLDWLDRHFINLSKDKIILMRNGQVKADFVKDIDKNCVLFDDYGKNCYEWEQKGGTAWKVD